MQSNRVAAVVLRQLYLLRISPVRVIPLFAWVGIDVFLWGFISKYLGTITVSGSILVPQLLGAVILWDFLIRVMFGTTTAFFEDVWSRNFLNMFASPLSINEYLAGLVITSILTSAVGLAVMIILATVFFGLSVATFGIPVLLFLFVLFLFGIALGIVGTALVLRLGPASEWLIWPLPALLSPFAGVFYPIATLPGWMQWIAYLLPPSYVFESARGIVAGQPMSAWNLAMGLGLAIIEILLACLFFKRVYQFALRSGLIPRYSAESVS